MGNAVGRRSGATPCVGEGVATHLIGEGACIENAVASPRASPFLAVESGIHTNAFGFRANLLTTYKNLYTVAMPCHLHTDKAAADGRGCAEVDP